MNVDARVCGQGAIAFQQALTMLHLNDDDKNGTPPLDTAQHTVQAPQVFFAAVSM
jgi:hypothetical protein